MEIKFFGVGGAFDVNWGNSSAVLKLNNIHYLIDCGNAVFPRLVQTGWASKIERILITHLHDDHVGSLSIYLAHFNQVLQKGKLKVLVPTEDFKQEILQKLAFSLGNAEIYADFEIIPEDSGIIAIDTKDLHIKGMQSYAYCFREGEQTIGYSGDLGDPNIVFETILQKDWDPGLVFHEFNFTRIKGHCHYQDLQKYQDRFEIYGYHNNPNKKPKDCKIPLVAETEKYLIDSFYPN